MADLKVIFIGGSGRSGSTLLENLFAQLNGVVSVGELYEIWKAGLAENRLCGCGRPFLECDFWMSVIDESFGGLDRIDVENIIRIQNNVCRIRRMPRMVWSSLQSVDFKNEFLALRDLTKTLFDGIRTVSGAKVIVDSSKTSPQAYMLSTLENIDLHIVQLVRDSRAVAYSWQRKREYPAARIEKTYMVRMSPFQSAIDWNMRNFVLGTLKRIRNSNINSYKILRYEDFVSTPESVLSELIHPLQPHADVSALFKSRSVVFRKHVAHTLEGNPSKFTSGDIEVRGDYEWKNAMRPLDRAIVTALTVFYLRKFGYV